MTVDYNEIFEKSYQNLNLGQRQAVDAIEGPVMVVAGPGTGKTQILALRIGNIIRSTDTDPSNILCLTYTDAATIAMRDRLLRLIGPAAYQVNIFTFHAFCNQVVSQHYDLFGYRSDLQVASDLERVDIIKNILDNLDTSNPLKRLKGDIYYDVKNILNLINTLKKEGWSEAIVIEHIEMYIQMIHDKNNPDNPFIYKKNNAFGNKGDLKIKDIEREEEKYAKTKAATQLYSAYNGAMQKKARFDFEDIILNVIKKFEEDESLLLNYQEKYHYILVDEYQDTNGAQNDIVFKLASYWERPNLFVVGDDDQSIYRFQGASMSNIHEFVQRFDPYIVILDQNYRSTDIICQLSTRLISYNQDRIVNALPHISKQLYAASNKYVNKVNPEPTILKYENTTHEEIGILQTIEQLHTNGVPYENIAILYTKHNLIDRMVNYCKKKDIPIQLRKNINLLDDPLINQVITLIRYVLSQHEIPYDLEWSIFKILHFGHWQIKALDLAKVAYYIQNENKIENQSLTWREVISSSKHLESAKVDNLDAILKASTTIESWITAVNTVTPQTFLELVYTQSGILQHILQSPNKSTLLENLNGFMEWIKQESIKNPNITLADFIDNIDTMKSQNIALDATNAIVSKNGVHFVTVHGAKGLEYEYVFVMRCVADQWEKKRGNINSFAIPPTLVSSIPENKIEESRRLFFVAMTRAERKLFFTYPTYNEKNVAHIPTLFLAEIFDNIHEVPIQNMSTDLIEEYIATTMTPPEVDIDILDHAYIDHVLSTFRMSPTSLNNYLQCPVSFYFDKILKIPKARNEYMGFGNAIHEALEMFFKDIEKAQPRSYGKVDILIQYFERAMMRFRSNFTEQQFENQKLHGIQVLKNYYENAQSQFLAFEKYQIEYTIDNVVWEGVPLSGKLDKIGINGTQLHVYDYKTGKVNSAKLSAPKDSAPLGGDYWRQIYFYKILLDNDPRKLGTMAMGTMDYVEEATYEQKSVKSFQIQSEELDIVKNQILTAYADIKAHRFTIGCNTTECVWCSFLHNRKPITQYESRDTQSDTDYDD